MKRAWLILDAMNPKPIQQQEAELIACCNANDIQIIGKSTYGLRFCAEVSEIMSIARLAVQNQCDYVAAADESCITDDYGILVRSFLPFEKDGLTLYTANKGEILSEFFKQWPLIRYRYRDPDEFSIDSMLVDGMNPDYPQMRTLDCSMFQIRRQGQVKELAFTDLCEMEQNRILDLLPIDCCELCAKSWHGPSGIWATNSASSAMGRVEYLLWISQTASISKRDTLNNHRCSLRCKGG